MATTRAHRVGDATVTKVPELALDAVEAGALYPDQANDPSAVEEARKLWPGSVGPRTGVLRLSIHAWLVRTPTRVILVDSAAGNDKDRPGMPNLLATPHIGYVTRGLYERFYRDTVQNIVHWLDRSAGGGR